MMVMTIYAQMSTGGLDHQRVADKGSNSEKTLVAVASANWESSGFQS
jgi:hypothetical protein